VPIVVLSEFSRPPFTSQMENWKGGFVFECIFGWLDFDMVWRKYFF